MTNQRSTLDYSDELLVIDEMLCALSLALHHMGSSLINYLKKNWKRLKNFLKEERKRVRGEGSQIFYPPYASPGS